MRYNQSPARFWVCFTLSNRKVDTQKITGKPLVIGLRLSVVSQSRWNDGCVLFVITKSVMDRLRWGRRRLNANSATETIVLILSIRRLIKFDFSDRLFFPFFLSVVYTRRLVITYAPFHRSSTRLDIVLASQYNSRAMTIDIGSELPSKWNATIFFLFEFVSCQFVNNLATI